jgi:C4-dicarboxylate-specific signal transduction histidine kinase/HAMP domain-containing protein
MGIALRTAMLSWLVAMATLLIFVVVIIPLQKRTFLENLESKAQGVVASLRDVTAGAAINEDYSSVVDHCREMIAGDRSIAYLVVTKNDGFSLIYDQTGWRSETNATQAWRPARREPTSGIGSVPPLTQRVFHYSQPFDYSGIQWGWIHVGLSLDSYDENVALVYRRTGLLAIVCMLLSLLASVVYAKRLVRPILSLRTVVQQVAGGDLSARASIESGDELGSLANSVNSMTGALLRRDQILHSVRFAADRFLTSDDWRTTIQAVLARLGESAGTSRAYLFENHRNERGELLCTERYEWVAPGVAPQLQTARQQNVRWYGAGLDRLAAALQRREIVAALWRELPASEQAVIDRSVRALLFVPIAVHDEWWGVLGFDDCTQDREWSDAERDSFRAVAHMLGTAMERQQVRDSLLEARNTLEIRVQQRTRELQEQIEAKEQAMAKLAEAQQSLIDLSRTTGMAEVATGVLHNVGNVLNSVNVSASVLDEQLTNSCLRDLRSVTALLQAHASDIAEFIARDPRGQQLPDLVFQLAEQLDAEHRNWRREVQSVASNIEHIKEIVAMQQSYARVAGVIERLAPRDLFEDAVRMNERALARHGITLERDYQPVPSVEVDKHKVLQILVNLVRNAKYAVEERPSADRRVRLQLVSLVSGRVRFIVSDNGVGIPPENLNRIFTLGFTTRRDGHGFGLHTGVLAARELGGSLTVRSDGTGCGATFTLELPAAPAA